MIAPVINLKKISRYVEKITILKASPGSILLIGPTLKWRCIPPCLFFKTHQSMIALLAMILN